ncbi:hypothetical protein JHK82_048980 [Glycine max]|uniref:Uncharacterized protein n=1 Tax=Glycine max TaxID=3847 RepID=C6T4R7_SOYBN|nr:unknown [Glycine max]KAG4920020.1 hypothetical protein JHK86_048833 [Glycine max]KAG5090202.1 hypothetical protein JHK82_048980 [Glycine max]KAH1196327.1 hypothetical protein GmHk_18G050369 [Glycine max]
MHTNSNKKDGNETKEDDCVDQDRNCTGLHVPKLYHSAPPRQLKQKTRAKQHKQHHCYHHWTPIRHYIYVL